MLNRLAKINFCFALLASLAAFSSAQDSCDRIYNNVK